MSIVAVTVNYRTPHATIACVGALLPELSPHGGRVVVVDNDSKDGSDVVLADAIKSNAWDDGRVELVLSPKNGGFGYGNNLGASHALRRDPSVKFLLFINPDAIIDQGSVKAMVDHLARHPDVAIVSGRIHSKGGVERPSSFRFPSLLSEIESSVQLGVVSKLLEPWRVSKDIPKEEVPSDWVSGAGFMIRVAAWDELGGFDEGFFLYFEEMDLCHRAHDLGWRASTIPGAGIEHIQALSTGFGDPNKRMPRYWFESRRRYWRKHHGTIGLMLANLLWTGGYSTFRLRSALQRKPVSDPRGLLGDFIRYNFLP